MTSPLPHFWVDPTWWSSSVPCDVPRPGAPLESLKKKTENSKRGWIPCKFGTSSFYGYVYMMYIYIHVLFVSNGGKINSKVVYIYIYDICQNNVFQTGKVINRKEVEFGFLPIYFGWRSTFWRKNPNLKTIAIHQVVLEIWSLTTPTYCSNHRWVYHPWCWARIFWLNLPNGES